MIVLKILCKRANDSKQSQDEVWYTGVREIRRLKYQKGLHAMHRKTTEYDNYGHREG